MLADDEVGTWLAGTDGVLGSEGPHEGGTYVIKGGESLAALCEQAYGTPNASGDAFQVLVAVASGILSVEEARAIRDGSGVVGPIANHGESWGLAAGTRLVFPRDPARLLHALAPDHLSGEQARGIEEETSARRAVTAIEDLAAAGASPLAGIYDDLALHFQDVAPGERRSQTRYLKLEGAARAGPISGAGAYETALTVTREADGSWSAERVLSAKLVVLIGSHFEERLRTTNARSLAEALAQLDLAEAMMAARAGGHDLDREVLQEAWGARFGPTAAFDHRETAEALDIGLAYGSGDVKVGGSVSGETAQKTAVRPGADGRTELGLSREYVSAMEASVQVDDQLELKGSLTGKRRGDEQNATNVKAKGSAKASSLGISRGVEVQLAGKGVSASTMTIDVKKLFGEAAFLRYVTGQETVLGEQVATAVYRGLTSLGYEPADPAFLRSVLAQAVGVSSVVLKAASDGSVTLTLISDPSTYTLPTGGPKAKIGMGQRSESEYVLVPARAP